MRQQSTLKRLFNVSIGVLLFIACGLLLVSPRCLAQEALTITTYYPSPYGSYLALEVSTGNLTTRNGNIFQYFTDDLTWSNWHVFGKRRSTGAIVVNGDQIGSIIWRGYDGSNYADSAAITAIVDGAPGVGDMPGAILFRTSADGAANIQERMRITQAGNVGIMTTGPQGTLHVSADNTSAGIFGSAVASAFVVWPTGSAPALIWGSGGALRFGTQTGWGAAGWSEKMRIDTNGNVTIAGTLTVNGNQAGAADFVFDEYNDIELLYKWREGEPLPFETGDMLNRDRLLRDTIIQLEKRIRELEARVGK